MNKQSHKRIFAHLIFYSLLINTLTPILTLANTDTQVCDEATSKSWHFPSSCKPCKEKDHCKEKNKHCKSETFDFVIVGAGNTGCVLAHRLSEDGKYTVCLLEAGRDDSRVPEILPEPSPADVPQPGDYHWGQYVRGGAPTSFELSSRGFGSWWFYQTCDNRPDGNTSTSYVRWSGWGGCTSHNIGATIRNPPYNWNSWGLPEWSGGTPPAFIDSPLLPYYKKMENRSQALFGTAVKLYDPTNAGQYGGFDPVYYGFDGMVPLTYNPPDNVSFILLGIMNTTLSSFGYPSTLVDLDYPPTTAQGGLSTLPLTAAVQILGSTITKPGDAPAPGDFTNNVPFKDYNPYGDDGFKVPQEYEQLNNPNLDPTALMPIQRVSSANTYLYAAQNNPDAKLTIKSEVFVTNLIIKDKKAIGVEYYRDGYNVYQAGRNPNTTLGGYGGTVGDAKFHALEAKLNGKCKIFAKKAVILSAGVYNSPQLLMLSGIGNKYDLEALGIKSKHHLPGVGQNLRDAQELFMFWQIPPNTPPTNSFNVISAFTRPGDATPTFEMFFFGRTIGDQNLETADPFVQKNWVNLRNIPAINNTNGRNIFKNILLDPTNVNANPGPIVPTAVGPVIPPMAVPPTPPNGPWTVTFTVPSQTLPAGGYTVSGSINPNYNGTFTCTNILGTNVPNQSSITLAYPTDPGTFIGGPITITPNPAFLPVMVDPNNMMVMLLEQEEHNRSTGYVKLQSADPTVPPLIFMNYLSDAQDLLDWETIMMNQVFPIWQGLQSAGYFQSLLYPSPADILFDGTDPLLPFDKANVDPAKLQTFLLNGVGGHHAVGTCKMGLANDPMAVVDQHGKVFGIKNLYVADTSVAPVSVNWPNGVSYIIGEKIAQDILAAYS